MGAREFITLQSFSRRACINLLPFCHHEIEHKASRNNKKLSLPSHPNEGAIYLVDVFV